MKKFLLICSMIVGLAVNSVMGATMASVIDMSPVGGAIAMNGVSLVVALMGGAMPSGVMGAGVCVEAWTGYLIKSFKTSMESVGWYQRLKSFDQFVNHDVIHLVEVGVKPEVLVNNTTYPLGISTIADADKAISLDKFQTKRRVVTDDALYAISYDKMKSDIELHKDAISDKRYQKAIHALAPTQSADGAPVFATSGAVSAIDSKRKALTPADLIKLKAQFDALKVPTSDRVLVLCPDHVNDLLAIDPKFADQYANYTTGVIANRYGFQIYEYQDCPMYNATTAEKLAFIAIATATDTIASVAFAASRALRADGSLKMYFAEAKNNPASQQNEVNFRKYANGLPMDNKCIAAIYAAKA